MTSEECGATTEVNSLKGGKPCCWSGVTVVGLVDWISLLEDVGLPIEDSLLPSRSIRHERRCVINWMRNAQSFQLRELLPS